MMTATVPHQLAVVRPLHRRKWNQVLIRKF